MCLAAGLPAHAEDEAELSAAAKYRHEVMEAMGSHMAAIAAVYGKRVDGPGHLEVHADALALTASITADLFTPGSEGGHALPVIWEEPEKVAEAATKSAAAAKDLADAVASGDRASVKTAFRAAGEACKACHESYKEEDHDH